MKLFARKQTPNTITFPHCDSRILHPRGTCTHCDACEDLHQIREAWEIACTGENDPNKLMCPSETVRTIAQMHRWPGNRPSVHALGRSFDVVHRNAEFVVSRNVEFDFGLFSIEPEPVDPNLVQESIEGLIECVRETKDDDGTD